MLDNCRLSDGDLYIGRGAGRDILNSIQSAKVSVKIVSPYISSDFVDLLHRKVEDGVDVRLIVSSDLTGERNVDKCLRKLIYQTQHTKEYLKSARDRWRWILLGLVFLVLIVLAIGFSYKLYYFYYSVMLLPFLYVGLRILNCLTIYWYTYGSKFCLSIPMSPYSGKGFNSRHSLVHAKIFLIDDNEAYLGSVNFTNAGFWKNYESRIKITDEEAINKLHNEFQFLSYNNIYEYMDIDIAGKSLYAEPSN